VHASYHELVFAACQRPFPTQTPQPLNEISPAYGWQTHGWSASGFPVSLRESSQTCHSDWFKSTIGKSVVDIFLALSAAGVFVSLVHSWREDSMS
jgi:hypothetical protein